jgi:hypothetical protein
MSVEGSDARVVPKGIGDLFSYDGGIAAVRYWPAQTIPPPKYPAAIAGKTIYRLARPRGKQNKDDLRNAYFSIVSIVHKIGEKVNTFSLRRSDIVHKAIIPDCSCLIPSLPPKR